MSQIPKWDHRGLNLASEVALWSKDPSTEVGAVIMDSHHRPVSWGFNGLPSGIADSPERLNNRQTKYALTIHAELNAILFAERSRLVGATIFVYPIPPCASCATAIVQNKLARVVSLTPGPAILDRWGESLRLAKEIFDEAGIGLDLFEMRDFHGLGAAA